MHQKCNEWNYLTIRSDITIRCQIVMVVESLKVAENVCGHKQPRFNLKNTTLHRLPTNKEPTNKWDGVRGYVYVLHCFWLSKFYLIMPLLLFYPPLCNAFGDFPNFRIVYIVLLVKEVPASLCIGVYAMLYTEKGLK